MIVIMIMILILIMIMINYVSIVIWRLLSLLSICDYTHDEWRITKTASEQKKQRIRMKNCDGRRRAEKVKNGSSHREKLV